MYVNRQVSNVSLGTSVSTRQILATIDGVLALGGVARVEFGSSASYFSSANFKLANNGALDPGFGQAGVLPTAFDRVTTVRELADGSVMLASEDIVCGGAPNCMFVDQGPDYHVQRVQRNGTPDANYANNVTPSHVGNAAILSDGTAVSLGGTYCLATLSIATCDPSVPRFSRPFTFDAVVIDAGGQPNVALEERFLGQMIRCSPTGTTVPGVTHVPMVEGTADDQIIFDFDGCMLKLNRDGTADAAFGDRGVSQVDRASSSRLRASCT